LSTLGQDKIPETWGCLNNFLYSSILQFTTVSKIQDAQTIKCDVLGKMKEGVVGYSRAMCESELSQMGPLADQGCYRLVFEESAIVKVNFQNVSAMERKSHDRLVSEL